MIISVYPHEYRSHTVDGVIRYFETKVRIEFSPSEGFDCDKLGKLEKDLAELIDKRLEDALKKENPA